MTEERGGPARRIAARIGAHVLVFVARFIIAVRADWHGCAPVARQRVYFANHVSNADMPMIWTALPPLLRWRTRPVAAADYWLKTPLRAFAGRDIFRAVLIDRRPEHRAEDPVGAMLAALDAGASLILFPEGNRNMGPDPLLPFRTGLYHLAAARPEVELVPTWVANLNEIMPKGEIIPLPLICTVRFGTPVALAPGEDKAAFLARAAAALLAARPGPAPEGRG